MRNLLTIYGILFIAIFVISFSSEVKCQTKTEAFTTEVTHDSILSKPNITE